MKIYKRYRIGEQIKYRLNNNIIQCLYLKEINKDKILVVLINNRLNEGTKVEICKNQII
jgi:hypothetical protein